jgi:hypothetical protein
MRKKAALRERVRGEELARATHTLAPGIQHVHEQRHKNIYPAVTRQTGPTLWRAHTHTHAHTCTHVHTYTRVHKHNRTAHLRTLCSPRFCSGARPRGGRKT